MAGHRIASLLKASPKGEGFHPSQTVTLIAATDRLAGVEADLLNVHVDFPLFERLATPVAAGRTTMPGIKIHDTRMLRLMEVLLHGGSQLAGWRTAQLHAAVLEAFGITTAAYSLTQLRYDMRKLRAHGLLERQGQSYSYRLTAKGVKVAALFVLFQKRVCGPLANTLFHHGPTKTATLPDKIEAAYHKADVAIQNVIDLLAA